MLKFIAEGELSRLVKHLRMLGFDCFYDGGLSCPDAIQIAAKEKRILLTLKPVAETLRIKVHRFKANTPSGQLSELTAAYPSLLTNASPFSRCLVCNESISPISFNSAVYLIPESVIQRKLPLYHCQSCSRIYWQGSHVKRMRERLEQSGIELEICCQPRTM